MRTTALAVLLGAATLLSPATAQQRQQAGAQRCGWYDNPTPANHWLTDRDGQWTLMTQGGPYPPGMDNMPDMTTLDWRETNGSYGYGCACVRMSVNRQTRRVTRIYSARPLPIARCAADRALPRRR